MKFLILGCNGMAGHTISLYLKEQGHDVFGFDRSRSALIDSVSGDARDAAFLTELIGKNQYDSVINCIGILNQFAEQNKALATYLNSYLPHFLADVTSGTDTQVIHMSTDCVFSGKRGEYTEDDFGTVRPFMTVPRHWASWRTARTLPCAIPLWARISTPMASA